jgi:23S rRNA pseudouridine2604 synthase
MSSNTTPPRKLIRTARPAVPDTAQTAEPQQVRLSKRMSALGLASRREADEWIECGWVRVNGQVMDVLGARVLPTDQITIDPKAKHAQAQLATIIINKPVGYVSGQAEDGYEPAIVLITPENRWSEDKAPMQWHRAQLKHLVPAGRLDIDSTGMLVLTQDGRVAKALIGEASPVEKEYLVRVQRGPSFDNDRAIRLLNFGLELDGKKLKPARVSWQNEDQLRFVLREGKKRQIRRMCELVNLKVVGLKRVRIGRIPLAALPEGQWRYLRDTEKF